MKNDNEKLIFNDTNLQCVKTKPNTLTLSALVFCCFFVSFNCSSRKSRSQYIFSQDKNWYLIALTVERMAKRNETTKNGNKDIGMNSQ